MHDRDNRQLNRQTRLLLNNIKRFGAIKDKIHDPQPAI